MRTSSGPSGPSRTSQPRAAQLVAQAVGLGVVLRRARGLALLEQLELLGAGLAAVPRRGSRARARTSISTRSARPTGSLAAVGLADPLEQRAQRRGGVEVLGERGEERVAVAAHVGGRRRRRRAGARRRGRAPRARRASVEALVVEGHRLAVVRAGEEHDQRVAADVVEHLVQADRRCRRSWPSSRRRAAASRCASRSARARRRAPMRVCAASFSWCGKTRSLPPPWISKPTPSSSSAIAEHSMCQPGPPAAPGRVPGGVLALLVRLPQREVQRVLLAVGALDALALVHLVDRAVAQRAVRRRRSARGSRRRRRRRRRGRARSARR